MSELRVLFEDNHLLVVDKPAGLLVQGGRREGGAGSGDGADDHLVARAQDYLKSRYAKPGNVYVGLVHRLDRNTSGVVVLAKTSKAAERLAKAFATRAVDKTYLAVASGRTPAAGTLADRLAPTDDGGSRVAAPDEPDAKPARLHFTTLASTGVASLLEVRLETGRKHQIRAQLAAAGHALLGDRRYAAPAIAAAFSRPALHALRIALTHPVRAHEQAFIAPIPPDFSGLCRELGLPLKPVSKNQP